MVEKIVADATLYAGNSRPIPNYCPRRFELHHVQYQVDLVVSRYLLASRKD